jgi:ubiquinone/menaquinone biosynthesis C-methylase UbiE
MTVLETACGSANDFRFLHRYGLGRFIDYTGFDLCPRNIENARAMFPEIRFEVGNALEIAAPDKAFDFCFVHDLFEHLSLDAMEVAAREHCRVTARGICIGFFNMDERRDHVVRPVDEYHWNTLSMSKMQSLFSSFGFAGQAVHIGTFLRSHLGCENTHNPNAYSFFLGRV